ncbi:hypothetical protein [Caballeronia hypogeia]|uniref:hypothetical protein n=1 Tax=Caballeronia hypogeia TaxID=1777140 RepID=UPI000A9B652D|nr:hypothetical protein [Caballeronia hypogeia]
MKSTKLAGFPATALRLPAATMATKTRMLDKYPTRIFQRRIECKQLWLRGAIRVQS